MAIVGGYRVRAYITPEKLGAEGKAKWVKGKGAKAFEGLGV
jgi:hypothetical protein